jgi:hypothetical protein
MTTIPGLPGVRIVTDLGRMAQEVGVLVEGIRAAQLRDVDQALEDVPNAGTVLDLEKEGVFPVQDRPLECPLGDRVIQGGTRLPEEQRQLLPLLSM